MNIVFKLKNTLVLSNVFEASKSSGLSLIKYCEVVVSNNS